MNTAEYLNLEYGEAQQSIQLELDWLESLHITDPTLCSECGGNDMVELPDGSIQCLYCD